MPPNPCLSQSPHNLPQSPTAKLGECSPCSAVWRLVSQWAPLLLSSTTVLCLSISLVTSPALFRSFYTFTLGYLTQLLNTIRLTLKYIALPWLLRWSPDLSKCLPCRHFLLNIVLVFYRCPLQLSQTQWLKTTPVYYVLLFVVQKSACVPSCVLCLGSHLAEVQMRAMKSGEAGSDLEASGLIQVAGRTPGGSQAAVPMCCWLGPILRLGCLPSLACGPLHLQSQQWCINPCASNLSAFLFCP